MSPVLIIIDHRVFKLGFPRFCPVPPRSCSLIDDVGCRRYFNWYIKNIHSMVSCSQVPGTWYLASVIMFKTQGLYLCSGQGMHWIHGGLSHSRTIPEPQGHSPVPCQSNSQDRNINKLSSHFFTAFPLTSLQLVHSPSCQDASNNFCRQLYYCYRTVYYMNLGILTSFSVGRVAQSV